MIDYSNLDLVGVKRVFYFDSIDSTNTFAKSCKDEDDLLVIAEHQTSGRGRLDRSWKSEKGKNITISLIKSFDIQSPHLVNFYTSYIVLRSLKEYISKQEDNTVEAFSLKWPNDILLNGKKVAGILSELIDINEIPQKYIIGIGINVNQETFSDEISHKAVSLKNYFKKDFNLNEIIPCFTNQFYNNLVLLERKDILMELWRLNSCMINRKVKFIRTDLNEEIEGIVIDVLDDGGIKIKTSENINSKIISTFYTGEISFIY